MHTGTIDVKCLEEGNVRLGDWRTNNSGMTSKTHQGSNFYTADTKEIRESFCFSTGAVPWQEKFALV